MILETGNLIFCSAGAPEQRNLFRESFVLIDNSTWVPKVGCKSVFMVVFFFKFRG